MLTDKTNYAQTLMHMIKGNLGTGILAMPASFAHTGLYSALFGLPFLCIISTYCVHLLVKSSQLLEGKTKGGIPFKYASLAKHAFKSGPTWFKQSSGFMCSFVDATLLIAQVGVCCVYLVFVVDNITSILSSYNIKVNKTVVFACVFPIALLLSYIKTLNRLAIASGIANILQAIGISIILEYLIRDISKVDLNQRDKFRPFSETALGFGSAMFAFEGISVVLPCYTRMKNPDRMSGIAGVINISYGVLLILYFVMGLFGFLKFGHLAGDSITLNLPPEPLYDAVRFIFTCSIFLTYPLQFYVPNEIIWNWAKRNILIIPETIHTVGSGDITVVRALEVVIPGLKMSEKDNMKQQQQFPSIYHHNHHQHHGSIIAAASSSNFTCLDKNTQIISKTTTTTMTPSCPTTTTSLSSSSSASPTNNDQITPPYTQKELIRYEYYCRTIVVILTFVLAISVPKLNLLMDLIGSISGTALSLILPALIHMAAFWEHSKGMDKITMILANSFIITFGTLAGISGTIFSAVSIINSFS